LCDLCVSQQLTGLSVWYKNIRIAVFEIILIDKTLGTKELPISESILGVKQIFISNNR
jgi:hypothetical protein